MTRVVLFGVGECGAMLARNLHEKGITIAGAYSRTTGVGIDIGKHFDLGATKGTVISADPAKDLPAAQADVALLATQSSLSSQLPLARLCLANGLDVLSLAEEGFHRSNALQSFVVELDQLAREAGKTVFFGGVQDVFWHAIPLALTGGSHTITRISGTTVSDLETLGADTLSEYPLDLDPEQFAQSVKEEDPTLSIMGPAVEALIARLALTVTSHRNWAEPVVTAAPRVSNTLGRTIEPGRTCGLIERILVDTQQGIKIETAFVSEILRSEQRESVKWRIDGEPTLESFIEPFPGHAATASALINRIPAVRAAPAGYRTVVDLPASVWWPGDFT